MITIQEKHKSYEILLKRIKQDYDLNENEVLSIVLSKFAKVKDIANALNCTEAAIYHNINSNTKIDVLASSPCLSEIIQNIKNEYAKQNIETILNIRLNKNIVGKRLYNIFYRENIHYMGQLVQLDVANLTKRPNIGAKAMELIHKLLLQYNLELGTQYPEWKFPMKEFLKSKKLKKNT